MSVSAASRKPTGDLAMARHESALTFRGAGGGIQEDDQRQVHSCACLGPEGWSQALWRDRPLLRGSTAPRTSRPAVLRTRNEGADPIGLIDTARDYGDRSAQAKGSLTRKNKVKVLFMSSPAISGMRGSGEHATANRMRGMGALVGAER